MSEIDTTAVPVAANPIVFPNRIRRIRDLIDLSMSELGERTGTSYSHLSYMERGLRRPSPEKAQEIADALNVSVDRLEVLPEHGEEYVVWLAVRENARRETESSFLFGQRLRSLRKEQGLSVRQLAARDGHLSTWQIRDFELHGRNPNPVEWSALARAFQMDSVESLAQAIEAVSLTIDLASDDGAAKRRERWRARAHAKARFTVGVDGPVSVEAKPQRSSVSIDGDVLAGAEWLLKGSVIRILRDRHLLEGVAYVVMSGKKPLGIGRARNGEVVCGTPEKKLIGVPWRIVSITFPDRLF